MSLISRLAALIICLGFGAQDDPPTKPSGNPPKGALILDGGGRTGPVFRERFLRLAGGPEGKIVFIPTGGEADVASVAKIEEYWRKAYGLKSLTVLHTESRAEADTEAFVAPLTTASGVIINCKRPSAVMETYAGTRVQRELDALLARGGVISSGPDGASLFGSVLARGGANNSNATASPDGDLGLGLVKNAAIEQQLFKKQRVDAMTKVVAAHPEVLGIGIDDGAGIVVEGNRIEVIGAGRVGVFDGKMHDGRPYELLVAGDRYDLAARSALRLTAQRPAAKKAGSRRGAAKGELLDFIPNQIRAETTRDGRALVIRDEGTRNIVREIRGHTAPITAMVFAGNLTWVATASQDQTIRLFTIRDGLEKVKFKIRDGMVTKLEVSDNDRTVIASFVNGTVREFQIPLARP
jgi:cyanophycinase